tara:strand:- start:156 stop:1433 length:1278 start_codon:yes stop_codon:yes gene_type:complete
MSDLTLYLIILMLLASMFVLVPVWRFRGQLRTQQSELRRQQNVDLFQQHIGELEDGLRDKLIEQEEFEKLKVELERNFLSDMESEVKSKQSSVSSFTKLMPLLLLFFIPIASFLLYRELGSGPELVLPELIDQLGSSESTEEQLAGLNEIARILDQRFQRRDDDIQTGYTLGTLFISLEKYADAARVFSQLADNMPADQDKATVLGQLAQAQYLVADSTLSPIVQATIDEALLLNSNEQAVMSILAVEALLAQDYRGAANYWRRQISQLAPGSAQVAELNERVATIESLLAEADGVVDGEAGDSEANTSVANNSAVTVRVDVDESIRDQLQPGMRVFVFARSESVQFPLAAVEYNLDDLPLTVTLDDSMAMIPQFTLSSVDTIYVGATIALNSTADAGGFRVQSESFDLAEQQDAVNLLVKDRIP